MSFFNLFKRNKVKQEQEKTQVQPLFNAEKRRFNAAMYNRLTADFKGELEDINKEITSDLDSLRGRCRDMLKNNSIYRRYINASLRSVIGSRGIRFQMQIRDKKGNPDEKMNDQIEADWEKWCRSVSLCGGLNWLEFQKAAYRAFLIDGEFFIRIHRKSPMDGIQYLALELIEPKSVPTKIKILPLVKGNVVINGIEFDKRKRPVGYFFDIGEGKYEQIPADEMLHWFVPELIGQKRGFPQASASIIDMHQLDEYNKAGIVRERLEACKMAFYLPLKEDADPGDLGEVAANGQELMANFEPGKFEILPQGWDIKFSQSDPRGNTADVNKVQLRRIAGGLDMSYNSLANDLEAVSYSSLRTGKQDERDHYRYDQQQIIDHLCRPVFNEWLKVYYLEKRLKGNLEYYECDTWIPRSFPSPDPLKDRQADVLSLDYNLTDPQKIVAEDGEDLEEVYQRIAKAKELQKFYKIEALPSVTKQPRRVGAATPENMQEGDEDGTEEEQE